MIGAVYANNNINNYMLAGLIHHQGRHMKKIDIRAAIEWKIECSLSDLSMNLGDGHDFEEYVVEEGKNNLRLPTIERTPCLFMLSGLDQFDRPLKRVTVLAGALKSTREHRRHLYVVRAEELDTLSVEWLIKNDRAANVLILNDAAGKVDQSHIRSLRDAKYKIILRVATEAVAGAHQYLPNTDWLVIEGGLETSDKDKRRLSNLVWECYKRDTPFWSNEGIDLNVLLAVDTSKVAIARQVLSDMPGYDFPDLGEYVLWDSKLDMSVGAKVLDESVMRARNELAKSTMQLAYRLHQLHEMAISSGKRAFYQVNFEVDSFGAYCEEHVGIKANLGRQYLLAIRTVNALDPKMLPATFDAEQDEVKELPFGHTRFRDVSKHLGKMLEIKAKDEKSFHRLKANVFNPDLSTRELMEVTETELGVKRPTRSITSGPTDSPTDTLRKRLAQLVTELKSVVDSSKHGDVDALVMQLLNLLPIPVTENEPEHPFLEDFGLETGSDNVAKVSRETSKTKAAKSGSHSVKVMTDPYVVVTKIDSLKKFIQPGAGWVKKGLCNDKIDLLGLCGFGCSYCSTDATTYLRKNRSKFERLTKEQNGRSFKPRENPLLTYEYENVIPDLEKELKGYRRGKGKGRVLAFSKLTDAFSPRIVSEGITRKALELIFEHTQYRVRIMTKSAIPGKAEWVKFLQEHKDRVVIGFSTGSLNDRWANKVEVGTGVPTKRLKALEKLQNAGVPTYGMLCPLFPEMLNDKRLDDLLSRISPNVVETIWAEPYNDRDNWQIVRDGFEHSSDEFAWFTRVYENGEKSIWSDYATRLYSMLLERAERDGWSEKLKYLLYEGEITADHAQVFKGLKGVLLQGKKDENGDSRNPYFLGLS